MSNMISLDHYEYKEQASNIANSQQTSQGLRSIASATPKDSYLPNKQNELFPYLYYLPDGMCLSHSQ